MDIEQEEMQFLGLIFGIQKEASKLFFTWREIFTRITLAVILPLTFTILATEKISEILYYAIWPNEFIPQDTQSGTPEHNKLSHLVSSERAVYILFKAINYTFVLIFSTSAVAYTIARVYISREITFKNVMIVVTKAGTRLIVTFLRDFFASFDYNMVSALTLYVRGVIATIVDSLVGAIIFLILIILYAIWFVYSTIIQQLANVVSVLEESYGIKAMIKSTGSIKGKVNLAVPIFVVLIISFVILNFGFRVYVVFGHSMGVLGVIVGCGALILSLFLKTILLGWVVKTVNYFVCKSYHH